MELFFKEITPDSNFLEDIKALYESAFPPDERRDFIFIHSLLADNPSFNIRIAVDKSDNNLAAFVSYWNFGTFTYVEHLAVMPQMRGKGIGHIVVADIFASVSRRVVLEVEPPVDEITSKRVRFYESLGMTLWHDFHYIQPPYAPHLNPIELRLMTAGGFTRDQLTHAVAIIKREVYGVTP